MPGRRTPGQLPLDAGTRSRGVVERSAGADLKQLREADVLADGTKALQDAYRLLAREVDRAEAERDRYGKINAARELVKVRQVLAPTTAVASADDLDAFVDRIAELLDT